MKTPTIMRNIRELSNLDLKVINSAFYLNDKKVNDIRGDFYENFSTKIIEGLNEEFSDTINNRFLNEIKDSLLKAKAETIIMWEEILSRKIIIPSFDFTSNSPLESLSLEFISDLKQIERKNIIYEGVFEFLKMDSNLINEIENLHSYLESLDQMQSYVHNDNGNSGEYKPDVKLNRVYSIAQLYYVIMKKNDAIENLLKHLEKTYSPNEENSKNFKHSIQLNLKKMDVAIFFHTLFELGLIKTDIFDNYNTQEKLKLWIDNSNIYYKDNNLEKPKVDRINRYFSSLNTKEWDKHEIKFIEEILIPQLNIRLQELKERDNEGLL